MAFINLRNHKKLLLIDEEKAFVGGLNLGAENTVLTTFKHRVNDVHFCLQGPIVSQLISSFANDWGFATGEQLGKQVYRSKTRTRCGAVCRAVTSGPDEDIGKIETLFAIALNAARHNVRIVTPYFLPDEKLADSLRLAVLRGVRVDVLVPEKSDHLIMDWALRGHLVFTGNQGPNYYLTSPPFDHTKLMTVDSEWCAFGSPNWDVRSLRLNFEILIECYTRTVVEKIDGIIDKKQEKSRLLQTSELASQRIHVRLRNAIARLFLPYL